MKNSLNKPYVISYDINGVVSNPIVGKYPNQGANRRERREKEKPFIGNGKQTPLTISGNLKYLRMIQVVPIKRTKEGKLVGGNKINHYLPQ